MTKVISKEVFPKLKEYLASRGYSFEERPHQVFLARGNGAVVNLYVNGKIVLGGSSVEEQKAVLDYVERLLKEDLLSWQPNPETLGMHGKRIGSDEVGKGDYFGPLIACAVMATEDQANELLRIGVRDSKRLSANSVREKASTIRHQILSSRQWKVVLISPMKYNILMMRMGNLNRVLAWAHARAIEDVLKFDSDCKLAISDQFGDEKYIEDALMSKGRKIQLIQTPGGERDVVVAAASIIARAEFLLYVENSRKKYHEEFPLGASNVETFAKELVARHGEEILLETAKIHFSTTERVVKDKENLNKLLSEKEKENR